MNKRTYDTIIVGATCFGVGLASHLTKAGKKVLIVEPSHSAAYDFCAPLKGERCDIAAHSQSRLSAFFKAHDIAREDGLYLPQALPYALSTVLVEDGIECLYNCIPTKVSPQKDGTLRLTVMSRRSALILRAYNIIDTTGLGTLPSPYGEGFVEKKDISTSLRAVCTGSLEKASPFVKMDIYDDSIFILSLPLAENTAIGDARLAFDRALGEIPDRAFSVATFAPTLTHTFAAPVAHEVFRNVHYCPSTSYPDPIAAFEAGISYADNLSKPSVAPLYPAVPAYHECLETDVAVVGLGTAGAKAALCAADEGARVIAADMNNTMGGVGTLSGIFDYYYGAHPSFVNRVNREAYDLLARDDRYLDTHEVPLSVKLDRRHGESVPPTVKSLAYDTLASTSALSPLYGYHVARVSAEVRGGERVIKHIDLTNGRRTVRVKANQYIDGADGKMCHVAGAEFYPMRSRDNVAAPTSNVALTIQNGNLSQFWCHNGRFSGYEDPWKFSQMLVEAGASPAFLDAEKKPRRPLVSHPTYLGIREIPTVKALGSYTLHDLMTGKKTDKPVFHILAPLDITIDRPYLEDEDFMLCEMFGMHSHGFGAGLPINVAIVKGFQNLLIAGKAIGVGHSLISAARMKGAMEEEGEAVGRLAAIAATSGKATTEVDYETLCSHLSYPLTAPHEFVDLRVEEGETWKEVKLPTTISELTETLATDYPAVALYSIYSMSLKDDKKSREALKSILSELSKLSTQPNILGEQSAIALGFTGDARALPRLLDLLASAPTSRLHVDAVRHHHPWFSKTAFKPYTLAILALGFIGKNNPNEHETIAAMLKRIKRNAAAIAASTSPDAPLPYTPEEIRVCAQRAMEKL